MKLPERGTQKDRNVALGVLMVHAGLASSGRGAEIAGVPQREFIDYLNAYGVEWAGPNSLEEMEE